MKIDIMKDLPFQNTKNYETYYRSARVQLSNKFLTNLKNFKLIWTISRAILDYL